VSTLKLLVVIALAAALTAIATFGGGWKWHRSGSAHVEHIAGWTWDARSDRHGH
jgi:hypothetical protein